ncbi:hypothetical protein ACLQ22_18315 [Micromonospora sp. DT178]|uniref:hypothetical protein n=1 Tax=Micromonospora sp. DT178 TaxID=3393436 RepID=UPI003CF070D8
MTATRVLITRRHVDLARSPVILAIPRTSSPGHLAENVAAARFRLTADDLAELAG